jgi:hypothetical protein
MESDLLPDSSKRGVDVYRVQKLGRWKTILMVLGNAHHQSESLRGGAEVLDRLRRESGTKLAQLGAASTGVSRNPWKIWWRCPGLNGGPAAYESAALPTELHRQEGWYVTGR